MTEAAQTWLNKQAKDSKEIDINDQTVGKSEELTGELIIENFPNVEKINFMRQGNQKGKITKVTIDNCPQVKKIMFDNNEIEEIIFKTDLPNLERLDLPDNQLKEVDVSRFPNLERLNLIRNPVVKVKGLENSTKLKIVNLLATPGLNGQEFKEWKEEIKSLLGVKAEDPLPATWKPDLTAKWQELENRPTKDQLDQAVLDARQQEADKYKDYIDPNDKVKLEEAAKNAGFGFKQEDIDNAVQNEKDKYKDFIDPKDLEDKAKEAGWKYRQDDLDAAVAAEKAKYAGWVDPSTYRTDWIDPANLKEAAKNAGMVDPSDKDAFEKVARNNGMVPQSDLDKANNEIKDFKDGLKDKLGLNDGNLNTWRDAIDKLKTAPDNSGQTDQIKEVLGLQPNDPLPSDWKDQLDKIKTDLAKTKDELDKWKVLGNTPQDVQNEINNLKNKPAAGGSGSGTGLTTDQQQKLANYDKLEKQKKWLIDYLKEKNTPQQYAKIEQRFNRAT